MLLFELKILRAFYRAAWQGVTCKKLFYSTARNLVADIASIAHYHLFLSCILSVRKEPQSSLQFLRTVDSMQMSKVYVTQV